MHLGGEGESRGEPRSRSRSRRCRAESSRVESPRAVASTHAPPTDESALCTLLARSLARLTWASENAGESRSAAKEHLRLCHSLAWRSGSAYCTSEIIIRSDILKLYTSPFVSNNTKITTCKFYETHFLYFQIVLQYMYILKYYSSIDKEKI